MASSAALLLQNQLYLTGVVKNGATGAPAINEDANFPLANIKLDSRYRFWRTNTTPGTPLQVDIDFLAAFTFRRGGFAMARSYRGGTGFATLTIYSGTGTIYPPSTWTSRGAITYAAATDNDLFFDFGANISARFWRWEFGTVSGQFSGKPWIVPAASLVTLSQGSAGAVENPKRVREKEKSTFLGGALFNDLGIGVAQRIREFHVPILVTQAQYNAIRSSQRGQTIYQHTDGAYYEVRHLDPTLLARQVPGVAVKYETTLNLAQVP